MQLINWHPPLTSWAICLLLSTHDAGKHPKGSVTTLGVDAILFARNPPNSNRANTGTELVGEEDPAQCTLCSVLCALQIAHLPL